MADDQDVSVDSPQWFRRLSMSSEKLAADFELAEQSERWKDQQTLASAALVNVVTMLSKLPGMRARLRPLVALMLAYRDLQLGRKHPLFENYAKRAGGRKLGEAQNMIEGQSTAAIELLMECDWTEDDAAREVAKILAAAGAKGFQGRKPVTAGTLKKWRQNAGSGDYPDVRGYADRSVASLRRNFKRNHGWPVSRDHAPELIASVMTDRTQQGLLRSASAPASSPVE